MKKYPRYIGESARVEVTMEGAISFKEILLILKKRWKLILLTTLFAASVMGTISYYLLTPIYEASTQILVNQKDSNIQLDSSQMRSSIELINTYSVIIKSPIILEKVIERLDLPQSVEQLDQKITINSKGGSQVFSLTVTDSSPIRAVEISNAVSEIFQHDIRGIMNVDNVNILAKAEIKENPIPVSPVPKLNIAVAMVLGLIVGAGLALLLEYLDNTLRNSHDVEVYLGLPVLGSINKITNEKVKKKSPIQRVEVRALESQIEK